MADVSTRLRAARERAGLTIDDVSRATKIKTWQLQAIERGEFERLPGEFFTRAFLRTYAREVRLSPDDIVREYDASRGAPERTPEPSRPADGSRMLHLRGPAPAALLRDAEDEEEHAGGAPGMSLPSARSAWPVLALALVLLMAISVLNREPAETGGEAGAIGVTGVAQASPRPAATTGAAPAPPDLLAPDLLSMEIVPRGEIWINASADGERAIYRLVRPPERLQIAARNELSFRIGNAAAFEYSINGVPGRVLGGPDEVREFTVTPDNVRTYHR